MSRRFGWVVASVLVLGGTAVAQVPNTLRSQALGGAAVRETPSAAINTAVTTAPVAPQPILPPCTPQTAMMQVPRPLESSELLLDSNDLLNAILASLGETRDDGELPLDERIYEKTLFVAALIDSVCPDGQCPVATATATEE